jgi:fibronectin type 3 domain-containing protein
LDLSWSINPENDLAGYHIYRSEQQDERGRSLQVELLLSPSYRDVSVQPGHRYWYVVTAVDRAGNESAPSEPVLVDLTKPLP